MLVCDARQQRTAAVFDCEGDVEVRRGSQAAEVDGQSEEGRRCVVEDGIEGLRQRFSWERASEGHQRGGDEACQQY